MKLNRLQLITSISMLFTDHGNEQCSHNNSITGTCTILHGMNR